jgi:hypothetical protein
MNRSHFASKTDELQLNAPKTKEKEKWGERGEPSVRVAKTICDSGKSIPSKSYSSQLLTLPVSIFRLSGFLKE